jgi:hypothetical protein
MSPYPVSGRKYKIIIRNGIHLTVLHKVKLYNDLPYCHCSKKTNSMYFEMNSKFLFIKTTEVACVFYFREFIC